MDCNPPTAIDLLWLGSGNLPLADVKRQLHDYVSRGAIESEAQFKEAVAVYCNRTEPETYNLKTIQQLREHVIIDTFTLGIVRPVFNSDVKKRMTALLLASSRHATFASTGEHYVAALIRTRLEAWMTVACNPTIPCYKQAAAVFGNDANDQIRPILEKPIKAEVQEALEKEPGVTTVRAVMAVATTIKELIGQPALHVDGHIASFIPGNRPALAVISDTCNTSFPKGVFILKETELCQVATGNILDIILFWLQSAVSCAEASDPVHPVAEFIFNGRENTYHRKVKSQQASMEAAMSLNTAI